MRERTLHRIYTTYIWLRYVAVVRAEHANRLAAVVFVYLESATLLDPLYLEVCDCALVSVRELGLCNCLAVFT